VVIVAAEVAIVAVAEGGVNPIQTFSKLKLKPF
jgi:hypothetical protein